MRIDTTHNKAKVILIQGESFNFPAKFFRAKKYGIKKLPPCPLGSPIARMLNHCYWMFEYTAENAEETLGLQGPSPTGNFVAVELKDGEHFFVHTHYLAGFSSNLRFQTKIWRIFNPTCWVLRHPLPVVASGPGTLLFYADEGLHWDTNEDPHQWGFIPNQVIGFNAYAVFRAEASRTDRNALSQIINACFANYRWILPRGQKTLVWGVNRPVAHGSHLIRHLVVHGVILLVAFLAMTVPISVVLRVFGR